MYVFEDDAEIEFKGTKILTPKFHISNPSLNMKLIENIDNVPEDYIGHRYKYDRKKWIKNKAFIEPEKID